MELKKILESIALQHNVKFNFAEEDIFGHSIFPPPATLPLRAKLVYISNRTNLLYKENGNYIIIYKGAKTDTNRLCAFVVDEYGQPVDNAVIQYGTDKKIVTGSDGYFELPRPVLTDLVVGQMGFQTRTVKPKELLDNDCKEIVLSLEVNELEEIVTERYLTSGISKKKDGSFSIKPDQFGILPGLTEPDVLLAMQQLPGINSIDETVSNINVRGGTHDQNLFTWNGIRLFQTGHFFGLISALSPNLAHQVKISKNGTSAFYGESVSSAIDISSRPSDIGNNTTSLGTNMIGLEFYTRIKSGENANFDISARRSFTDVLDFPTYSKYSKRIFQNTVVTQLNNSMDVNYKSDKEFFFYDFTGQYHQKLGDKDDIYVDMLCINNSLDFAQGTITETRVVTEVSDLNQLTLGGTAAWRRKWSDTHTSEFGLYGSYYNVDGRNASIEFNQVKEQENTILDAGFHISDSYRLNPLFNIKSGYQYNEIGIENGDKVNEPQYSRTVKEVLRSHALIGELEYDSPNRKIYSRAGIRGNYIEQFGMLYAEPRIQVSFSPNVLWQIELLAEQKSQTASQIVELQGDFLGIEKRRWILSNDKDIPVQRSRQASVGVTYKDKGWLVSIENFYKKVNGITSYGQAFQDQLELIQATGSYTVVGTEFLVQKQFKGFYAWLSYTWNDNDYSFDNIIPEKFPSSFEIKHTVNSAAIYEWHNFKVALGSKWYTGKPVTPPLSQTVANVADSGPGIIYASPNSAHIGNFFQVNFSASYVFNITEKSRLQLGVSVLNIFNRKNIINRYYRLNNDNDAIEVVNTYSLERTPNALIKLTF
ncbi:TonB-dependent receptor [Flavobacterium sp. MFBS3-15]|uniref:TonB-dependent receptor n=1 Tax=Flavobacterium sp. MFBS3-15 TaxID=2989816 RepID=UPI0022363856|nr:TonB-dependent receptor [Flavobacterium sp. MFBS3-15]MCW4470560.1 TonB-dependent receptor [Flavobacterium sp. MFBS3-15]